MSLFSPRSAPQWLRSSSQPSCPSPPQAPGGLDLVLVIAVVWTMALGLEGGLVWAFLGGLIIDVLLMRPLGLTAFIDLLAVGAAWVIGHSHVSRARQRERIPRDRVRSAWREACSAAR